MPRLGITMVSALILKVLICHKPLRFIYCQAASAFLTNRSFLFSAPDPSVRFLSTRDSDFNPSGSRTDRKDGGRSPQAPNSIRARGEELWADSVQGRRRRYSSPKSVFAAGTAKRTAEMLRRKSPQISEDEEEQLEQPPDRSRKAGCYLLLTFSPSCKA